MQPLFRLPRGTVDILPNEQRFWEFVSNVASKIASRFFYHRIDTPLFESAALFQRGVGQNTDIVMKEMYTFEDHGGDMLSLRPEGTASICRAYIEHGMSSLSQPVRLFYIGPMFRYERPQAGRFRQFHQFGAEAIGDASPSVDAEIIDMAWSFLNALGISNLVLRINTIGDRQDREHYEREVRRYYEGRISALSAVERERLARSPLRMLDAKEGSAKDLAEGAPQSIEFIGEEAKSHFQTLLEMLNELKNVHSGFTYRIDHTLVRGLDYYNRTVFEMEEAEAHGQQSSLLGGGRYDPLMGSIGGTDTAGCGFAAGLERIVNAIRSHSEEKQKRDCTRTVIATVGCSLETVAFRLAASLRRHGVQAILAPGHRSLKAKMRYAAGQVKARQVVIVGPKDFTDNCVSIRWLTTGEQRRAPADDTVALARMLMEPDISNPEIHES